MQQLFSDPFSLVMLALLALLIIFMFRNGRKRQAALQQLQSGMQPGAEVMLQSGIFGTVLSIDEADNKVTIQSGSTTLVVHRNAIGNIVTPVEPVEETPTVHADDDPAFGERADAAAAEAVESVEPIEAPEAPEAGDVTPDEDPKNNS